MELSLFLAKFLGIYLLIFTLLWVVRRNTLQRLIEEMVKSDAILAFSGIISLLFGIAIAVSHSIWEMNWRGLITLVGYLAILKGIMRLGFPEQSRALITGAVQGKGYWVTFVILALLGLYLTCSGFSQTV